MILKRQLLRLFIRFKRWERKRFEQRLKRGLIVGKPHHTTKPLSETYMDSLK